MLGVIDARGKFGEHERARWRPRTNFSQLYTRTNVLGVIQMYWVQLGEFEG